MRIYSLSDIRYYRYIIIQRFKGLESPIVFLWGLDTIDLARSEELLYIGMSRAKSLLILVGNAAVVDTVRVCRQMIELNQMDTKNQNQRN